eukprot:5729201-Pleurochrysis_carterae.AAC.2
MLTPSALHAAVSAGMSKRGSTDASEGYHQPPQMSSESAGSKWRISSPPSHVAGPACIGGCHRATASPSKAGDTKPPRATGP